MAYLSHLARLVFCFGLLGLATSCFGGWLDDTEVSVTPHRTELPTDPLSTQAGESDLDMACRTVRDMYAYKSRDHSQDIVLEVSYPGDSPDSTPRDSYHSGSSSSSTSPNAAKIFIVFTENNVREPVTLFHYITTGPLEEPLKLPKIRDFSLPWKERLLKTFK